MAYMASPDIPSIAEAVYTKCAEKPSTYLFHSSEIQEMDSRLRSPNDTQHVINFMLQEQQLKILMQGKEAVFKLVSKDVVSKLGSLTSDELIIYEHIEAAGREGIWTKQLKTRTNQHQTVMTKCLKSLENKKYIKSIKSVKHPGRKIYMLYDLQPSIEVTGGPWFTDAELDAEFIDSLLIALERFIQSRSIPKQVTGNPRAISYPPSYTGFPTLSQITNWVKQTDLTEVDLGEADIKSLLDVLIFDGKIERALGGTAYKSVRGTKEEDNVNGFTEAPCGRCPVFALCEEGGPVSASNCVYWKEWLDAAI